MTDRRGSPTSGVTGADKRASVCAPGSLCRSCSRCWVCWLSPAFCWLENWQRSPRCSRSALSRAWSPTQAPWCMNCNVNGVPRVFSWAARAPNWLRRSRHSASALIRASPSLPPGSSTLTRTPFPPPRPLPAKSPPRAMRLRNSATREARSASLPSPPTRAPRISPARSLVFSI